MRLIIQITGSRDQGFVCFMGSAKKGLFIFWILVALLVAPLSPIMFKFTNNPITEKSSYQKTVNPHKYSTAEQKTNNGEVNADVPFQNEETKNQFSMKNYLSEQPRVSLNTQDSKDYDLRWEAKEPIPTSRSWAGSTVYNGKIYVVGGCSCESGHSQFENAVNDLEVYDTDRKEWDTLTPMSMSRVGPAVAVVDSKMYVMGGFNPNTWSPNPSVEVYDFQTDTWSAGNSMPTGRSWSRAVVFNDKIYVLGGVGNRYYDICEVYDPSTDSWDTCASFQNGRYLHATVATDDAIYVIGGSSWNTNPETHFADIQKYNPMSDTWTEKTDMPFPYDHIDAVTFNNKIWVFGKGNHSLVYDIASDTWEEKTSNQNPTGSYCVSRVSEDVYRIGGGGWGPTLHIVECLDLTSSSDSGSTYPLSISDEVNKISIDPKITSIYKGARLEITLGNTFSFPRTRGAVLKISEDLGLLYPNGTEFDEDKIIDGKKIYNISDFMLESNRKRVFKYYIDTTQISRESILAFSHGIEFIPRLEGNEQEALEEHFLIFTSNKVYLSDHEYSKESSAGKYLSYKVDSWCSPSIDSSVNFYIKNVNTQSKHYKLVASISEKAPLFLNTDYNYTHKGDEIEYVLFDQRLGANEQVSDNYPLYFTSNGSQDLTFVRYKIKMKLYVNSAYQSIEDTFIDIYKNQRYMLGLHASNVFETTYSVNGEYVTIRATSRFSGLNLYFRLKNSEDILTLREVSNGEYVLDIEKQTVAETMGKHISDIVNLVGDIIVLGVNIATQNYIGIIGSLVKVAKDIAEIPSFPIIFLSIASAIGIVLVVLKRRDYRKIVKF